MVQLVYDASICPTCVNWNKNPDPLQRSYYGHKVIKRINLDLTIKICFFFLFLHSYAVKYIAPQTKTLTWPRIELRPQKFKKIYPKLFPRKILKCKAGYFLIHSVNMLTLLAISHERYEVQFEIHGHATLLSFKLWYSHIKSYNVLW